MVEYLFLGIGLQFFFLMKWLGRNQSMLTKTDSIDLEQSELQVHEQREDLTQLSFLAFALLLDAQD